MQSQFVKADSSCDIRFQTFPIIYEAGFGLHGLRAWPIVLSTFGSYAFNAFICGFLNVLQVANSAYFSAQFWVLNLKFAAFLVFQLISSVQSHRIEELR